MDQEKLLEAPGEEEIVYDDIIQDRGRYRSIGQYSQWGPNRPSHTLEYPLKPKTGEKDHSIRYSNLNPSWYHVPRVSKVGSCLIHGT